MILSEVLLESFNLIWDMYEAAIKQIKDDHWKTGDIDYLTPSRLMSHVVMSGDFYMGESREFEWNRRFGSSPMDLPQDQLPSKKQVMEYHLDVKNKITNWLQSQDDEALISRENVFTWTGSTRMSRVLYLLSHYRQHFGELNAELRRRGLERIKWKTY